MCKFQRFCPVKAVVVSAVAVAVLAGSSTAWGEVISVSGDSNIFGAGHTTAPAPGGGGGGTLPPVFSFTAAPNLVLTFSTVTGTVRGDKNNNNGNFGANGPDGGEFLKPTDINSTGGISGISGDLTWFLVGVFLSDAEPVDPAPAILNFKTAGGLGASFATLSPELNRDLLHRRRADWHRQRRRPAVHGPNRSDPAFSGHRRRACIQQSLHWAAWRVRQQRWRVRCTVHRGGSARTRDPGTAVGWCDGRCRLGAEKAPSNGVNGPDSETRPTLCSHRLCQ